jgi:5-methylcytosine-specific restriction endonuclease McrA
MLTSSVLVLNQAYFPINVTSLKRAFTLLYIGMAKAVDEQYQTFNFDSWSELSAATHHDTIGLVDRVIRVPRVIILQACARMPQRGVRFSRRNIMLRDKHQCQYCAQSLRTEELNLDHVVPRVAGGQTTWENMVTSCHRCNRHKGGRTPAQAHMKLIRKPFRPTSLPFLDFGSAQRLRYSEWRPYLNVVDFSYWNVELEP